MDANIHPTNTADDRWHRSPGFLEETPKRDPSLEVFSAIAVVYAFGDWLRPILKWFQA